jgi:alpha-glucosidase
MIKRIVIILIILLFQKTHSQVTFLIDKFPENTPDNKSIYISGDFEGWTGGEERYKLSQNKNTYYITLPYQEGVINFKFTQGSWNTVETDSDGNNIENRSYISSKLKDTIKIEIANWNQNTPKKSTASTNVFILSKAFKIPQLNRTRRIWIYLPPDYDISKKSYPVLYMHDGQNLFDEATSFSGEWQVDETLNELYINKNFGLIVIGIDNGGSKRMDEYSPWINTKYNGGGEGNAYLDFIVETLKPYVDRNYRTLADKQNTAIMGSSLGALISHYAALKYPDTFGLIGVFSPAFGFSETSYDFASKNSNIEDVDMYFLVGDNENPTMVGNMNKMISLMKSNGFAQKNIISKVVSGGEHNEKLWRENFEEAILSLFDE